MRAEWRGGVGCKEVRTGGVVREEWEERKRRGEDRFYVRAWERAVERDEELR